MTEQSTNTYICDPTRRHHFMAIGGIGMSAIAQVLLARGVPISGCDAHASPMLERLAVLGAEVHVGHDPAHLRRGDVVVLSDAIKTDNPELQQAQAWGLPIYRRADVMGYLANSGRGVAVSGTHGKTTTSGMLTLILLEAGLDPTCILGGELAPLGGNARPGGDLVLVEACEAYESFLALRPEAAIVLNIEADHMDHHGTLAHLHESFRTFLRQVRALAVLNGDDPVTCGMTGLSPRAITYGAGAENAYRYTEVVLGAEPAFTLVRHGEALGRVTLRVPGLHNVSNATGAAALAMELGADFAAVQRGLAAFPGMHRRFERIGMYGATAVVDDYAHHPTEIRATLQAARAVFPGHITAIFQPHLYSRTRDLLADFADALALADTVLIAPIYAAREAPIPGVTAQMLVEKIAALPAHPAVRALASPQEASAVLAGADGQNGDAILTIGAGDINAVAYALVNARATSGQG